MRKAKALGLSLALFILCAGAYHYTGQNHEFNSLIASHPHVLGGIFLGNSTYYEYYQVNTSDGTRYYKVTKAENGKILKIQAISHSDYLVYTGKALDIAKSLVEESGKLPPNASLITYNVTNLTVRLYYALGGRDRGEENTIVKNSSSTIVSNITSTLAFPGDEFAVATVNLTSGSVSVKVVSFEGLPKWVQNVVKELIGLRG